MHARMPVKASCNSQSGIISCKQEYARILKLPDPKQIEINQAASNYIYIYIVSNQDASFVFGDNVQLLALILVFLIN